MPVEGPVGEQVIEADAESAPIPDPEPGATHSTAAGVDTEDGAVLRPRRRVRLWTAVAVGVIAALFVGVLATRPSALSRQAQSPLLGHPAPAISGPSVTDGPFRSLSSAANR